MFDRIRKRIARGIVRRDAADDRDEARPEASANVGEYQLLYKYLRDRYANRVVLTFGEIEDLLGFALPTPARFQLEWWGCAGPLAPASAQSDSWTLARRSAKVNLLAQSVVFDREVPSSPRKGVFHGV